MENPQDIQQELIELLIKGGQRCAYDLRHAADDVHNKEHSKMYHERAKMWLTIFNPTNGGKDYRAGLHQKILMLEIEVERLKALCEKNGISCESHSVPF